MCAKKVGLGNSRVSAKPVTILFNRQPVFDPVHFILEDQAGLFQVCQRGFTLCFRPSWMGHIPAQSSELGVEFPNEAGIDLAKNKQDEANRGGVTHVLLEHAEDLAGNQRKADCSTLFDSSFANSVLSRKTTPLVRSYIALPLLCLPTR